LTRHLEGPSSADDEVDTKEEEVNDEVDAKEGEEAAASSSGVAGVNTNSEFRP